MVSHKNMRKGILNVLRNKGLRKRKRTKIHTKDWRKYRALCNTPTLFNKRGSCECVHAKLTVSDSSAMKYNLQSL
jgi:hypothetical protein